MAKCLYSGTNIILKFRESTDDSPILLLGQRDMNVKFEKTKILISLMAFKLKKGELKYQKRLYDLFINGKEFLISTYEQECMGSPDSKFLTESRCILKGVTFGYPDESAITVDYLFEIITDNLQEDFSKWISI